MKTKIKTSRTFWNKIIVIIVISLIIIPGYTLAETPDLLPNKTSLQPSFIASKGDLKDEKVISQQTLDHPMSPAACDVNIIELLEQLNESLILGFLQNLTKFGPRETGSDSCKQAARYLFQTFQDMGLVVRYHNYTDDRAIGSNIEATLYGSDSTNTFIICAHYDSVAAGPGADDDGSGVAAVLSAAKIMSNYEFDHTVRFVAFSGEEQGLIGSHYYAEDAYKNNESIVAVLNADMIGFAPSGSDGNRGKIYENDASEWIVTFTKDINQLYTDYIGIQLLSVGESRGSDHYSFWQYGYDSVFYAEFNFNDYYHSADDTIENMNITYATRFSRLILATLAEMAQRPRAVLEVTSISGGLGLTTDITNIGNENAEDVVVKIVITGGPLNLINISSTSENAVIYPEDSIQIKTTLFRFGKISITVIVRAKNTDQTMKHAAGFIVGPFVLHVVNSP